MKSITDSFVPFDKGDNFQHIALCTPFSLELLIDSCFRNSKRYNHILHLLCFNHESMVKKP